MCRAFLVRCASTAGALELLLADVDGVGPDSGVITAAREELDLDALPRLQPRTKHRV